MNLQINRYEPQGVPSPKWLWHIGDKPWTQISGQSPEEFNLSFSSAKAEREGGLKKLNGTLGHGMLKQD
ncbi:hypothetical protein ACFL6I_12030 [candidate division KSB1 bacterium]